jgi:hypothetical protein
MVRSLIGEQVPPPEWLRSRQGMVSSRRPDVGNDSAGLKMLRPAGVATLSDQEPGGCECLIMEGPDRGHIEWAVALNPDQEWIAGRRVALLYEGLMYVGDTPAFQSGDFPRMAYGDIESMWWTVTSLEPGWYDNTGTRVTYELNPQYLPNGAEVMPVRVLNGSRLIGRMVRHQDREFRTIGGPVENDRGVPIDSWAVASYILPRGEHRSSLPAPVPPEWVDPTEGMTHLEKVARLNERFATLTRTTAEKAVDEDWCSEYEDACEAMGLAEEDYTKEKEEDPVTYTVRVRLSYHLTASALDSILNDRFGGSHDIQEGADVESIVSVTVTQNDGEDFDEDSHDWDDILSNAGYDDFDEHEIMDSAVAF